MDQYLSLSNENACRLCMRQKGNISIFGIYGSKKILDRIEFLVQIKICESDGLPNLVCKTCIEKLESACNFKQQVEDVHTYIWKLRSTECPVIKKEEILNEETASLNGRSPSPAYICDDKTEESLDIEVDFIKESSPSSIPSRESNECNSRSDLQRLARPKKFNLKSKQLHHDQPVHGRLRLKKQTVNKVEIGNVDNTSNNIENSVRVRLSAEDSKNGKVINCGNDLSNYISDNKLKKEFECTVCFKKYRFSSGLKNHICTVKLKSTENLRKYMCDQCGRAFQHRSVLQQHMSTHSGMKHFSCTLCKKMFTRASHLTLHARIHNNIKPYVCELCGRSFTKSSDLRRHCRIHSDVRNYPCPLCSKTFKRSGDVASHIRSHTGDRPYHCPKCDKKYSSHSSMKKHQRTSSGCFTTVPVYKITENIKSEIQTKLQINTK